MGILLKGKYYLGLLLVGVAAVLLVRAEERFDYSTAQASLVAILLLLALMVWDWWKANGEAPPSSPDAYVYYRAANRVLACVAVGLAAVILNASRWDRWRYKVVARSIGYGALVAGAFFIGGVLLGYLFGLRPASSSQGDSSESPPRPHTNLEEIADWLTKLILGAGLVELTHLRAPIYAFTVFMATGVNPPFILNGEEAEDPGSAAIALAIMSFFSASGLLYGYLWTRYQQALKEAPPALGTAHSADGAVRDRAA
ncbi:MAG: hypothetical protein WBW01_06275 [Terriglobales bacterium]